MQQGPFLPRHLSQTTSPCAQASSQHLQQGQATAGWGKREDNGRGARTSHRLTASGPAPPESLWRRSVSSAWTWLGARCQLLPRVQEASAAAGVPAWDLPCLHN